MIAPLTGLLAFALVHGPVLPPAQAVQTFPSGPAGAVEKHLIRLPHVRIDLKRRQVIVQTETVQANYGLEFLLCRAGTKEYESLLRTKAKAADIHAGLLALGLTQGKPARWSGTGMSAKFMPPQGPELKIILRWTDPRGRHETDAGRWLTNPKGKAKAAPAKWVFIGSEVLPDGRYVADLPEAGGVISVANVSSAVIDVPFESTQALDAREFIPDKRAVPEAGTAVEMVVSPLPGAQKADHARVLLEIDALGRMRLEGRAIQPEALTKWASKYLADHIKGQVVIRADAGALTEDLRQARDLLQMAGVDEIETYYLPPEAPILPRTPEQVQEALDCWRQRLANPRDYLVDPLVGAEALLRHIDKRCQQLDDRRALWTSYARQLRQELAKHKAATTRPSSWQGQPGAVKPGPGSATLPARTDKADSPAGLGGH